ncbi:MAG TPA: hypothetical protein P5279_09410 [Anaerohalosphaeraceae bacterium]|nr:hypothetical protein [Anaerohalosphaeraceae bacterium]HRT50698.1 hypothetical protein [Anaerohalosphaeraceae bacterium]HRT86679.1 hypothetical protein [Anaerohalosphaeraceae bacterium]
MANNNMVKPTPASRTLICLSSIIIVGMAAYNWTVSPQTSYLRAAHLYEVMMGDAGRMTKTIKTQMNAKSKTVENLHREIAKIQGSFFTPKQANEFFLDLEPIAHQCSCTVDKLVFIASDPVAYKGDQDGSCSITVKRSAISFTGLYPDIINFLRRLSNYSQRILINDLNIESNDMVSGELNCQMTITVYIIEDKEFKSDE